MSLKLNFGKYVCDDAVLKKYMAKEIFNKYINLKKADEPLDVGTAKEIAKAVKKWAFKMGALHSLVFATYKQKCRKTSFFC